MIRFEVQMDASELGWATILVHTKDRVFTLPCSDLGGDSLGELARAFAELAESDKKALLEVNCYGEPSDSVIRLRRNGGDLEVTIMRFSWEGDHAPADTIRRALGTGRDKDWLKMRHARNKKAKLRQSGSFVEAMRSLVQSFQAIEDRLDRDQYERAWGFDYPSAELAVMRRFLTRRFTNDGEIED